MRKNIYIIIGFFLLFSCGASNRDDFYNNKGNWNTKNIPLLKPYSLCFVYGSAGGWILHLKNKGGVGYIKEVNVINNVVLGYSTNYTLIEDKYPESWFILKADHTNYLIFNNRKTFLKKLEKLNIINTNMLNCDELFEELRSTGRLSWFPKENE